MDEIEFNIQEDGTIGISADDFLRLTEKFAIPKRSGRLAPADPDAQVISPAQAALLLGCHRSTIDRLIADGLLPAIPLRRGRRKKLMGISKAVLERWIRAGGEINGRKR